MINITKLYQQLQEGKTTREYFIREARRQFPQFISPVTSFNDAINILKGKRLVSENETKELTKEVSGAMFDARLYEDKEPLQEAHKLDTEQILDRMSPYAVKKGIEIELKKEKTFDNTTIDKVKTRVAKKLKKNPKAYEDLVTSNAKEVDKTDKDLETKELKQELVDKKNAMVKPKGFKAEKANTKASKKENKKGNPKGVKVMQDKGVTGTEKVIKEDVRSFDYKHLPTKQYSANQVKMQDIVDFVKKYPGITTKELALKAYGTGYNYGNNKDKVLQGAVYMINRAVNAGKIVKVKDIKVGSARFTYFTPEDYQEFLQKKKSMKIGNISIKENVLSILKSSLLENMMHTYVKGAEVHTPDGIGIVDDVIGGTLTVKLGDGSLKDFQINVIDKATRDTKFDSMKGFGDTLQTKKEEVSEPKKAELTSEEKLKSIFERISKIKDKEKAKKMLEAIEQITGKDNLGNDITLAVTQPGKGQSMVNKLKSQGAKSVKVNKIQ
jgi:hypothetical protein